MCVYRDSNPRLPLHYMSRYCVYAQGVAFVAQMVERRTFNPVVAGSSPAEGAFYCEFAPLAQWLAHRTSNPGVAGSSPAWGAFCQKVENPGFDPGASSLLTTHSTD